MEKNMAEEKNIILLTIDCLRADHLHCMGYPKEITPTIDALAENGVLFTKAMANAPYTTYSIPSFLTSTMPPVKKNPDETLTVLLKKNGFSTAAFNPNPIILSRSMGGYNVKKGFDRYDIMLTKKDRYDLSLEFLKSLSMSFFRIVFNKKSWFFKTFYRIHDKAMKSIPEIIYPKQYLRIPSAEELNKHAINWVKNQNQKFFLWIHYMDVHEPYAPLNYKNRKEMLYLISKYRDFPNMLTEQELQKLINLYDLEIKNTDNAINNLIKNLKKLKCFDNSIIIISADHGDAFKEHGVLGHGLGYGEKIYDENLHVPIVIYGINKKGVKINKQVQLLDLAPTIFDLLNIPKPPTFLGENMFLSLKEAMIINSLHYIGYRTPNYKLIISKREKNKNELYNLKKDPQEKHNIYNSNNELALKVESDMINLLTKYKKKTKILSVKSTKKI